MSGCVGVQSAGSKVVLRATAPGITVRVALDLAQLEAVIAALEKARAEATAAAFLALAIRGAPLTPWIPPEGA